MKLHSQKPGVRGSDYIGPGVEDGVMYHVSNSGSCRKTMTLS